MILNTSGRPCFGLLTTTQLVGFGAAGGAFSPLSLSPYAWYRADLGVTGTTTVTNWADQSGNGRDLNVNVSNPDLVSSAVNGQPAINFDTGDILYRTSFSIGSTFHAFFVMRPDAYAANKRPIWFEGTAITSSESPMVTFEGASAAQIRAYDGTIKTATPSGSPSAGSWGLLQGIWKSGTEIKGAWNNGSYTTTATGTFTANGTADGLSFGAARDGSDASDLAIAEAVFYASEITGGNLTDLLDYFRARYALW